MASFYHTIPGPDEYVKCPYDPVHMIRMKKLQYHLMKCRKNFPNKAMATCPFNAKHVIPEAELRFHTQGCPDKHSMHLLKKDDSELDAWAKGNTEVPTYFPDVNVPDTENWDSEVVKPRIGVQAREMAGIGYHKSLVGLQPSQKKAYYDNLRKGDEEANVKLFESLNVRDEDEDTATTPPLTAATAAPVAAAPVSAVPVAVVNPFAQPTLGRGRGLRPKASTVTPGASEQKASELSLPDLQRLAKKTKKKLKQIVVLLERQANGEMLNEEEKIKVAHKATFEFKYQTLETQIKALEAQMAD